MKDHEEHLSFREGTRRGAKDNSLSTNLSFREGAKDTSLSAKGHEGPLRTPFFSRRHAEGREGHLFIHEGPRRTAKNTFFPRRHAKDTRGVSDCSCVAARPYLTGHTLLWQIAVLTHFNEPWFVAPHALLFCTPISKESPLAVHAVVWASPLTLRPLTRAPIRSRILAPGQN